MSFMLRDFSCEKPISSFPGNSIKSLNRVRYGSINNRQNETNQKQNLINFQLCLNFLSAVWFKLLHCWLAVC